MYQTLLDLEARLYGFAKHTVELDGLAVTYYSRVRQHKPLLVLLHGYTADKGVWLRCARHLARDFHVVIPDLAGHGETPYDENIKHDIPFQAELVAKLVEHLQAASVFVAGNSMGGFIAAHYATLQHSHLKGVVLIDPAGLDSPLPSEMDQQLRQGRNPFLVENHQQFKTFYAMTMARPPYFPGFLLRKVGQTYQQRRPRYARIFGDFFGSAKLDNTLDQVALPVLLLWGAEDQLIHVSAAQRWQEALVRCEAHIWPELGHMPMLEAPRRTADVMREFLAQNGAV